MRAEAEKEAPAPPSPRALFDITIGTSSRDTKVIVNGEDITRSLRGVSVSSRVGELTHVTLVLQSTAVRTQVLGVIDRVQVVLGDSCTFEGVALTLIGSVRGDIREPQGPKVIDGEVVNPVLGEWSVSIDCGASAKDSLLELLEGHVSGTLSFPYRGRRRYGHAFLNQMRVHAGVMTLEFQGTGVLEG